MVLSSCIGITLFIFHIADQSQARLRFAKVQEDIYACHDSALIEYSTMAQDGDLVFAVSPCCQQIPRSQILCAVSNLFLALIMILFFHFRSQISLFERAASASLIFELPKTELSKAQRALRAARKKPSQQLNNATAPMEADVDESKVRVNGMIEKRHKREWVQVMQLQEQQTVSVRHYRELLRYKVMMLLRKRPFSDKHWRKRILFSWDENLYRAVLAPLGDPVRPSIVQTPTKLAMTLDGAWASRSHRMLQVLSTPGRALQDFLAFQDFNRSDRVLFSGYAMKHIDVRFVLELAAVFTCNSTRLPGNRMQVEVFVTVSTISDDGNIFHALPLKQDPQIAPVSFNSAIEDEVKLCRDSMLQWRTPQR